MKNYYVTIVMLILFAGCKKAEPLNPKLTTVNVVNAVIDIGAVKVNYFGKDIAWKNYTSGTALVNFGSMQVYSVLPGNKIQIVPALDTVKTLFNSVVSEVDKDIYSVFLTGTISAPENIVKKENLPAVYSDMCIGVRLINLSPESNPLNLTLSSNPMINEFTSVGYKQITDFKKLPFPAFLVSGSNVFQVRDASGILLASYTLPTTGILSVASARYRNITLVVKGLQGTISGANALSIFCVGNF